MRKTRGDSVFARLEKHQRDLIDQMMADGKAYSAIVALCATWGVKTSSSALCAYFQKMHSLPRGDADNC